MPLQQNPEPVDHARMLRESGLDPAEGFVSDVGDTSPPVNVVAPDYRIECTPTDGKYTARVVIGRRASEGDNTSVYLKAGVFETNASLMLDLLEGDRRKGQAAKLGSYLVKFGDYRKNRVYLYMPDDMAELNRQAEVEHCDDLVYAYQQTLGALDFGLASLQPVTAATDAEARGRLLANLRDALPPHRCKNIGLSADAWAKEHQRLSELTRQRDARGWHFFDLELVNARDVPGHDTPVYLTGARRDSPDLPVHYLRFTKGTTEIGRHSTDGLIT